MLNSLLEKKLAAYNEQRGNFGMNTESIRKPNGGISLADSMLPMQGARAQFLVRELDPTCCN